MSKKDMEKEPSKALRSQKEVQAEAEGQLKELGSHVFHLAVLRNQLAEIEKKASDVLAKVATLNLEKTNDNNVVTQ